ncbi:MAG: AMP-binding protein [Alphaproteobacteria bacterium]|nr:AMP-binding protein [Alphaproteobacteria bacterium]
MTIERVPTPYDDKIYSQEWRAWRDPEIPDWIDPIEILIGRHLGTPAESRAALIVDGKTVTYRELAGLVERYAGALAAVGVAPESRLLLFGTDSLDYVATWLGAVRLGAVPVVVSDLYKQSDLLYFLTDTAVNTLFIDSEQTPKLIGNAADLPPSLKTVIVRGGAAEVARACPGRTVKPLQDALAASVPTQAHRRHSNDVTYMFYSGGTTGTAKGITHLAYDFLIVPARHGAMWEYGPDDVVYATSKKYFTHGIWPGLLIPLHHGATAVLDRRPPMPDVVLANMRAHGVTKLVTVPTVLKNMIEFVTKSGEPAACPKLKFVVSASEKMPPEMFEQFQALFGVELHDSIGSSEITYEWIVNTPKVFKRGSLGKPVYGCEVRLIAPDGTDVTQANVPGECWIKSRTACFYYWRKYDKSRETFVGDWARTGDNLIFDEDGFFWFSGRNNDLFKVKGLWVSPIDIEAALTAHRAVREAAVVAFDNADGLTQPRAFIVLRDGFAWSEALKDELKAAVAPLGSYKIPGDFVVLDQLPRTTLMKIDRRALREP